MYFLRMHNKPKLNLLCDQTNICVICCESDSLHNLCTTKCNHVFHKNCLQKWCILNNSCPTCRRKDPCNFVEKANYMTNYVTNNVNESYIFFAYSIVGLAMQGWNNYLETDYKYYINKILDIVIIVGVSNLLIKI